MRLIAILRDQGHGGTTHQLIKLAPELDDAPEKEEVVWQIVGRVRANTPGDVLLHAQPVRANFLGDVASQVGHSFGPKRIECRAREVLSLALVVMVVTCAWCVGLL